MGVGSFFLFINATPWSFLGSNATSYQMNTWSWPSTIASGQAVSVYIEEKTGGNSDDGGEVWYSINDDKNKQFEIFYHATGEDPTVSVQIHFDSLGNPAGTKIPLSWEHNQDTPFILANSGTDLSTTSLISNNPPQNWMKSTYDRISCLTLRELAMPGTHDSGMSEFNQGTGLATFEETETQIQNIAGQLKYGARWFDIRPVIAGGHWATGHYSWSLDAWRGGNGQSIASVIDQVNAFTASNSELIILYLSHGYDTDIFGGDENNHLTQDNWSDLLTQLLRINHRVEGIDSSQDLTKLPVSRFIENGPAVIIIVDDEIKSTTNTKVDLSSHVKQGIFSGNQFPTINSYANNDKPQQVMEDQFRKLQTYRTSPKSEMFLLSWTLTPQGIHVINPAGIVGIAEPFNKALFKNLWDKISANSYPNMLMVDAYPNNGDITALAMAINFHFAPTCPRPGSKLSSLTSTLIQASSWTKSSTESSTSPTATHLTSSSAPSSITYTPSPTTLLTSKSSTISTPSSTPISTSTCAPNLLVCQVQDPTRLEAPWAGVSAPFPQCYDPTLYICSDNFLCPVDAPKIPGEYACSRLSERIVHAIMCNFGKTEYC